MKPVEALRAATSASAACLGLGDQCGRLAVGFTADLLLVDGDPTRDLSALQRPALVVAAGHRLEPLVPPPPAPSDRAACLVHGPSAMPRPGGSTERRDAKFAEPSLGFIMSYRLSSPFWSPHSAV